MKLFNYRVPELLEQIDTLTKELKKANKIIAKYDREYRAQHSVIEMLNEAIPESANERRQYVADIALFYSKIFSKKLPHFISDQLSALSQVGRSEKEYEIYRSNINCFRLIEEWMIERTNEHFGDLETARQNVEEASLLVDELKNR